MPQGRRPVRPRHLSIQGFGPFREKQEIDFQEGAEFLLISGKTGSGKTTIFDAIMFALFGKLPGTREETSIVSTLLQAGEVPFVEIEFSLKGNLWRVYRQPAYMRPSRRGKETLTRQAATVQLSLLFNGQWKPRQGTVTEINSELEEMLGLTADEFSRIVLLPQGEFQAFLMADTQEKRELLQKIFPAAEHKNISDMAREMKNEKQYELKQKRENLQQLLEEFDPGTFSEKEKELRKKIDAGENVYRDLQNIYEKQGRELSVAEKVDEDFREREKTEQRLKEKEEKKGRIDALEKTLNRLREGEPLFALVDEYERLENSAQELTSLLTETARDRVTAEKNLKEAEKKVRELPAREKEIQAARDEMAKLKELLPKEKVLAAKMKELEGREKTGRETGARLEKMRGEEKKLYDEGENMTRELAAGEKIEASFRENVTETGRLREILKGAREYSKIENALEELAAEKEELARSLASCEATVTVNRETLAAKEAARDAAAASTLAAGLVEGAPCPVCGSTAHPAPAAGKVPSHTIGEELLAAEENLRLALAEEARIKGALAINEKRTAEARGDITAFSDAEKKLPAEVEKDLAARERELRDLEKKQENLRRLKRKKEENEKAQRECREHAGRLQEDLSSARQEYATLKAEVDILTEELGGRTDRKESIARLAQVIERGEEEIRSVREGHRAAESELEKISSREKTLKGEEEKALKRKEQSLQVLTGRLEATSFKDMGEVRALREEGLDAAAIDRKIRLYREETARLRGDLELLKKRTGRKKRPDLAKMRESLEGVRADLKKQEEERRSRELELRDLLQQKDRYEKLNAGVEEIMKDAEHLVSLADDLTGKNPKNINFQNFILGAYLREVTRYATERFNLMSNGRYSLLVNEEVEHRGRQAGLELDVFDAYSGGVRSVKTLSGGEKFLAAISLSLGLADVIQERAGGIELDAIFIDEGFGSLDEESLDRALTILDDIRQNRLVGIISHVPELKNRIPGQLEVVKGPGGSRII